jgi:2-haloacid dehalogenase
VLSAVIFDLGGVVLQWQPERAYEQVLAPDEVAGFLDRIDFHRWNRRNDGGHSFDAAEAELIEQFPDDRDAVLAYRRYFAHTLTGMVPGTSAVIAELGQAGIALSALTNWSGETFPVARERFGILDRFSAILVSGEEKLLKPDPAIFALACERAGVVKEAAARDFGLTAIRFTGAEALRDDFAALGLLGPRRALGRPVYHWALRSTWETARLSGTYPWSSRNVGYEAEGFVHASFADQVDEVRHRYYADLSPADLVLLELDPDAARIPVVVEAGGSGEAFPHLFSPWPVAPTVARDADWRP